MAMFSRHKENNLTSVDTYGRQRSKTDNNGYDFHFIETVKYCVWTEKNRCKKFPGNALLSSDVG